MRGGRVLLTNRIHYVRNSWCLFFFFNDTATTEIYTLSLHDALPISSAHEQQPEPGHRGVRHSSEEGGNVPERDRKSTRLNSSHSQISYAVFCLKKKNSYGKYYWDSALSNGAQWRVIQDCQPAPRNKQ